MESNSLPFAPGLAFSDLFTKSIKCGRNDILGSVRLGHRKPLNFHLKPLCNKSDYPKALCCEEAQVNCLQRPRGERCLLAQPRPQTCEWTSLQMSPAPAAVWLKLEIISKHRPSEPSQPTEQGERIRSCSFKPLRLGWFFTQQWITETLSKVWGMFDILGTCQLLWLWWYS